MNAYSKTPEHHNRLRMIHNLSFICNGYELEATTHIRTGEAPALAIQGEADSLQRGACSGCAAQGEAPALDPNE